MVGEPADLGPEFFLLCIVSPLLPVPAPLPPPA